MIYFIALGVIVLVGGMVFAYKEKAVEAVVMAIGAIIIIGLVISGIMSVPEYSATKTLPFESSFYQDKAIRITHMPGLKEPLADKTTRVSRNFWSWHEEPAITEITMIYADLSVFEKPYEPKRIDLAPKKGPVQ